MSGRKIIKGLEEAIGGDFRLNGFAASYRKALVESFLRSALDHKDRGLSKEDAFTAVAAAYETPDGDQSPHDREVPSSTVPAGRPNGEAEASNALPQGHTSSASVSPPNGTAPASTILPQGQRKGAGAVPPNGGGEARPSLPQGQGQGASPPPPSRVWDRAITTPREPSRQQIAAAAVARKAAAVSIFDTFKINGWAVGDIRYSSLERIAAETGHQHRLVKAILARGKPADPNAMIREYLPEREIQRLIQASARSDEDAA